MGLLGGCYWPSLMQLSSVAEILSFSVLIIVPVYMLVGSVIWYYNFFSLYLRRGLTRRGLFRC